MAKEETNVLRIRKGDYKENIRTHKRIRLDHKINKEIKDILQQTDIINCIKFL
jgi:hypothetical protein